MEKEEERNGKEKKTYVESEVKVHKMVNEPLLVDSTVIHGYDLEDPDFEYVNEVAADFKASVWGGEEEP